MSASAKSPLTLDTLHADVQQAATVLGLPYNDAVVWPVLKAYEDIFMRASIGMRVTTKAQEQRELSVRYLEMVDCDPYPIALNNGLYTPTGNPVEKLYADLHARYRMMGYGIDLGTQHGFEKIWPFFVKPPSVTELAALDTMPDSVRNTLDHFARFDWEWVGLFGMDYLSKTINLYFTIPDPSMITPEKAKAMIEDLGFSEPNPDLLKLNAQTPVLYYTFSWDYPSVERLCFAIPATIETLPVHIDWQFAQMVDKIPCYSDERHFMWNTTYGHRGDYYKNELDYTGNIGSKVFSRMFESMAS